MGFLGNVSLDTCFSSNVTHSDTLLNLNHRINATTTTISTTTSPTSASGSKKTSGAGSVSVQSNALAGFGFAAIGALFAVFTS